jgi:hypothetical protein
LTERSALPPFFYPKRRYSPCSRCPSTSPLLRLPNLPHGRAALQPARPRSSISSHLYLFSFLPQRSPHPAAPRPISRTLLASQPPPPAQALPPTRPSPPALPALLAGPQTAPASAVASLALERLPSLNPPLSKPSLPTSPLPPVRPAKAAAAEAGEEEEKAPLTPSRLLPPKEPARTRPSTIVIMCRQER